MGHGHIRVFEIYRLYTLYQAGPATGGTLPLRVSSGVEAYDVTFG